MVWYRFFSWPILPYRQKTSLPKYHRILWLQIKCFNFLFLICLGWLWSFAILGSCYCFVCIPNLPEHVRDLNCRWLDQMKLHRQLFWFCLILSCHQVCDLLTFTLWRHSHMRLLWSLQSWRHKWTQVWWARRWQCSPHEITPHNLARFLLISITFEYPESISFPFHLSEDHPFSGMFLSKQPHNGPSYNWNWIPVLVQNVFRRRWRLQLLRLRDGITSMSIKDGKERRFFVTEWW